MRDLRYLVAATLAALHFGLMPAAYAAPKLTVTSTAFRDGRTMPTKYGCTVSNSVNPPLAWSTVPAATQSIAILLVDKDASNFMHWGTFNIPATRKSIPSNFKYPSKFDTKNDFYWSGYGSPCPPQPETHTYTFYVVALNIKLPAVATGEEYLTSELYQDIFGGKYKSNVVAVGILRGRYKDNYRG